MSKSQSRADWHPASWQSLTAAQQPTYPDPQALDQAVADLSRLPPIVTSWEIDALRDQIARAQRGEAFLLQGGDCAETFYDCTSESIVAKLKILVAEVTKRKDADKLTGKLEKLMTKYAGTYAHTQANQLVDELAARRPKLR